MHRLRPGDIDVVGGLGDSLVAGSGALEEFAVGTFIEARGVSWCVGGQGDWRRFLTVPNLLKVLNALNLRSPWIPFSKWKGNAMYACFSRCMLTHCYCCTVDIYSDLKIMKLWYNYWYRYCFEYLRNIFMFRSLAAFINSLFKKNFLFSAYEFNKDIYDSLYPYYTVVLSYFQWIVR